LEGQVVNREGDKAGAKRRGETGWMVFGPAVAFACEFCLTDMSGGGVGGKFWVRRGEERGRGKREEGREERREKRKERREGERRGSEKRRPFPSLPQALFAPSLHHFISSYCTE
jgi:hypothetical protein